MTTLFVREDTTAVAVGAITAQQVVAAVRDGAPTTLAWLRLVELATRHGWKSSACRTFVAELVKRAAGPGAA